MNFQLIQLPIPSLFKLVYTNLFEDNFSIISCTIDGIQVIPTDDLDKFSIRDLKITNTIIPFVYDKLLNETYVVNDHLPDYLNQSVYKAKIAMTRQVEAYLIDHVTRLKYND